MSNKANGGIARAQKLTPEARKEISQKGVDAKAAKAALLKPIHEGILKIGGLEIDCYILEKDGQHLRILSGRQMAAALGNTSTSGGALQGFLAGDKFKPFLYKDKPNNYYDPIPCLHRNGLDMKGYRAEHMVDMLLAIVAAWDDDSIPFTEQEEGMVERCNILLRGLAKTGITAMIDEATGYQYVRERDALARYLQDYVIGEMQKWVRTFPPEFFSEISRLRGWKSVKPSQWVGYFINETYSRLGPDFQIELKKHKLKTGGKMHQYLTTDKGHPALKELLGKIVTLMQACDDGAWTTFKSMLNRALPIIHVPNIKAPEAYDDEFEIPD